MEDERTPIAVDDETWLEPAESDEDDAELVDVRGNRWRLRHTRPWSSASSLGLALVLLALVAVAIAYALT